MFTAGSSLPQASISIGYLPQAQLFFTQLLLGGILVETSLVFSLAGERRISDSFVGLMLVDDSSDSFEDIPCDRLEGISRDRLDGISHDRLKDFARGRLEADSCIGDRLTDSCVGDRMLAD